MRESKITRTITTTTATILCLDVEAGEPMNRTFQLPGEYKKERDIIKAAEKIHDEPNVKLVHVVDTEVTSKLYGMPESLFLKYAVEVTRVPRAEEIARAFGEPATENEA